MPQVASSPDLTSSISLAARAPLYLLSATLLILRTPRLLLLSIIPAVSGVLCFLAAIIGTFAYRRDITAVVIDVSSWWEKLLSYFGIGIVALIGGALAAFVGAQLAGAVVLESISREVLARHKLELSETPLRARLILRSLIETLLRIVLFSALSLTALLLGFFPPLALIPVLIGALLVGADLFDTPLTVLGYSLQQRLTFTRRHWSGALSLGAAFACLLVIPLFGALLLPLGMVAVSELVAGIEKNGASLSSQKPDAS